MGRWSSERARAIVFLVVLASLGIGAQAANAAAPASTGFTWSVPPLISRQAGPDGLSEYATPPAEVGKRRWPVRLQASGPCVATETYQWDASGLPEISGRGRCVAVEVFPREGTYGVTLRSTLNGREVMHSGQVTVRNWLIVVLGDSVASGEGNPDVPGARGARWQDRRCHRSANAGVAIAARMLEESDPHVSVVFVDLACSGASIDSGLLGGYAGIDPPEHGGELASQVAELAAVQRRAGRPANAVIISIGANDAYFSSVAKFCARRRRCFDQPFDPSKPFGRPARGSQKLPAVIAKALGGLEGSYATLAAELPSSLPKNHVYLLEYFDPTHDMHGNFCRRVLVGVDRSEVQWLYEHLLVPLNEKVAAAATENGWHLVGGIAADFRDHGYCARDDHWIRTLTDSWRVQGESTGALHPNLDGQEDIARRVLTALHAGPQPRVPGLAEVSGSINPAVPVGGLAGLALLALGASLARSGLSARRAQKAPVGPTRLPVRAGLPAPGAAAAAAAAAASSVPTTTPGLAIAQLLGYTNVWVHRRVETVAMVEDTLRRHVSVDFTLPTWAIPITSDGMQAPRHLAPIAILGKSTLTNFDLRDEDSGALPMLTREQNGEVAASAIIETVEQHAREPLSARARQLIRMISVGDGREPAAAFKQLIGEPSLTPGVQQALRAEPVIGLINTLAGGFIVLVEVTPGERRVLKFSYEEPVQPLTPLRELLVNRRLDLGRLVDLVMARLAWRPFRAVFNVPDAGSAASYHFELAVAKDLEVLRADFRAVRREGSSSTRSESSVGAPPRRRAHLYLTAPPGSRGFVVAEIRAQRQGTLSWSLLLSGFVMIVLAIASTSAGTIAHSPATAGPLLLGVPGAIAAYVSRPDDHRLTSRLLIGTRVLLLISAACSFSAAALAAFDPSTAVLRHWLPFIAAVAANAFVLLLVTYLFPRPRRR